MHGNLDYIFRGTSCQSYKRSRLGRNETKKYFTYALSYDCSMALSLRYSLTEDN